MEADMAMDVRDFDFFGDDMLRGEIELDPGEAVVGEGAAPGGVGRMLDGDN